MPKKEHRTMFGVEFITSIELSMMINAILKKMIFHAGRLELKILLPASGIKRCATKPHKLQDYLRAETLC